MGGDPAAVGAFALENPGKVWVYVGYSGWAAAQLANELERGVWVHARGDAAMATVRKNSSNSDEVSMMWRSCMKSAGMPYLADFPRDKHVDETLTEIIEE